MFQYILSTLFVMMSSVVGGNPVSVEDLLLLQTSSAPYDTLGQIYTMTDDPNSASIFKDAGYFSDIYQGARDMATSDPGSYTYQTGLATREHGLTGLWTDRVQYPYTSTIMSYQDFALNPTNYNRDTFRSNVLKEIFNVKPEDGFIYVYMEYLRLGALITKWRQPYSLFSN